MSYVGDFRLGDTFDVKFTTRRFTTGAPFTLAGSPVVSAYVGNSTTQITAGITLSVDFDGVTGLNNVRVVATSGNGYATASNYQLVITTGTVDSVSVTGEVIAQFSIEARSALMPEVAGRVLAVDADFQASANINAIVGDNAPATTLSNALQGASAIDANVVSFTAGAINAAAIADGAIDAATFAAGAITATVIADNAIDAGAIATGAITAAKFAAGAIDAAAIATGAIDADALAADAGTEIGTAVWATTTRALTVLDEDSTTLDLDATIRAAVGLASANLDTQIGDLPTNAELATALGTADDAVLAAIDALPTAAENADAVWEEAQADHVGAGTFGIIASEIADILTDTGTTLQGELDGIQADTEDIQARLPAALVGGRIDATVDGTGLEAGAAAVIADAVWDEALAGHLGAGSTGEALNAAGAAGDPWVTALPGAYGAGSAGFIVGTNLNATVSSRATQASVDTIDGIVDAILVDTAEIGAAGAGLSAIPWNAGWDAEVQSECNDALVAFGVSTLNAAAVNAEVVDALNVDTYAEPGQGSPAATTSIQAKIGYLYKAWRNRSTQTASEYALYGDDGVTKDHEAAISDDSTTLVRGEVATGA